VWDLEPLPTWTNLSTPGSSGLKAGYCFQTHPPHFCALRVVWLGLPIDFDGAKVLSLLLMPLEVGHIPSYRLRLVPPTSRLYSGSCQAMAALLASPEVSRRNTGVLLTKAFPETFPKATYSHNNPCSSD